MNGVLTGDLTTTYSFATDNVESGASAKGKDKETKTITVGTWLGPCAAGQGAGEGVVTLPNGTKISVKPRS